jgi:hypothetical protein
MSLATILKRVALVLTGLFALGGLLFALGYAFDDPGGWPAVLISAAVVVPLVGLTVLAARAAPLAIKVLTAAVVLFVVWGVLDRYIDIDMPTIPVIALVLALPIAVMGQRYATRAGGLLLVVAAVPLLSVVTRLVSESSPDGSEGPGLGDLLGGSSGVVILPLAVLAVLFFAAGALGRAAPAPTEPSVRPSSPAARS